MRPATPSLSSAGNTRGLARRKRQAGLPLDPGQRSFHINTWPGELAGRDAQKPLGDRSLSPIQCPEEHARGIHHRVRDDRALGVNSTLPQRPAAPFGATPPPPPNLPQPASLPDPLRDAANSPTRALLDYTDTDFETAFQRHLLTQHMTWDTK